MCVEEITSGATANAGPDMFTSSNQFTMQANTPPSGYSGTWSVVSGTATISNPNSRNTNVTLTSGNAAKLRWTINTTGGATRITALDPKGQGGFENCCNAYDNGWTEINHTTNTWQVGTVSNPSSGNRAAFISNNGGTSYSYTTTSAQTSHLYRDVILHPGATNINLNFKWKAFGESGNDRLLVYTAPTSVTPVAGTPASPGTTLSGATLVSTLTLHSSYNYQTASITLPNSLAGTTVRLIFTWQNNSSAGTTPPASIDEVSLAYDLATCSHSDDINLAYSATNSLSVNNADICPGNSAILTATGCNSGTLLWSTGSTQSSITVNPLTTTSYTVTCTPPPSSNLLLNPGFESTTNLQDWSDWGNGSITTNLADIYSGSKAAVINTMSASWGGIAQEISVSPGQRYRLIFYAKTTNTNALPVVRHQISNSSWTVFEEAPGIPITSASYQRYEYDLVIPPNAAYLTIIAEVSEKANLYVDQFELYRYTACQSIATGTVNVTTSQGINLSNLTVGNCINHPLQDVVPVSVNVSWTSAPSNDYLGVTINNKTEYIHVGGGATSPQTLTFYVAANGATNIPVSGQWYFNPSFDCSNVLTFNAPNPCSVDVLNCDILYLCGLDKPADGDAFDHGLIEYIMANNSGNVIPVLVKDNGTSNDFYNPMDQVTPLTINVNDYDLIVVSPTTQGNISSRLGDILLSFKGSILNMNYLLQQGIGMSNGAGYYEWGNTAYTSATNPIVIYDYDNINPTYSYVKTGGTTKTGAVDYLWFNAGDANGTTNAMGYKYTAHSIPGVSTTHGHRQYLGIHMNGLYSNAQNGGYIPAPASSYFHPAKHLTPQMKVILDQTLRDAAKCTAEVCTNGFDDDGDNLIDCFDPDCWKINNREFDEDFNSWEFYIQNGASATRTIDNTSQLSGKNSARVNVTTTNGTNWNVQFVQINELLEAGKTYEVSFRASAASARTINVFTDLGASPWTGYFSQNVNLTTTGQTFSYTYTQNVTTSIGRIGFNLGQSTQTVWIDNVIFKEVCTCTPPSAPIAGTITQPNCTLNTGSVALSGLPSVGSWTITRTPGGTSYTGSGTTYTVMGLPANATYTFTVTSFGNCTSPASANVVVNAVPTVPTLSGTYTVCIGQTTNITPNSAGTWTSANTGIATVTNAGVVTGVARGNTTLTYTRTADGCSASRSVWVTLCTSCPTNLLSNPSFEQGPFTHGVLNQIGGTPPGWTNSATVEAFNANFTVPDGVAFCYSPNSAGSMVFQQINTTPNQNYTLTFFAGMHEPTQNAAIVRLQYYDASNVAIGSGVTHNISYDLGPNPFTFGGPYTLSLTAPPANAAFVRVSFGLTSLVTAFDGAKVDAFCLTATPCVQSAPVVGTITQPTCTTPTGSAVLSGLPASGSWTITRSPGGNTYTGSGTSFTVTSLPANTTYTFTVTNASNCTSPASANVLINAIPGAPALGGTTSVCIGGTTNVTPSTGGTWSSSNSAIASITNAGVVSAIAAGAVTLTYTRTSDGCSNTLPFTVLANPTAPIIGTITQPTCITTTGSVVLSGLPASGSWTITRSPGGTTYTSSGTSYTVTGLPVSTTYTFTVTNSNNCVSLASANVVINAIPSNPTLGGASAVCVGFTANVTPNSLGTWTSSNTAVATITNAGVVTGVTTGSVTLTYTRTSDGCSNTTPFTVNANPTAPVVGTITQPTCTTPTGSVVLSGLPASGSWTITRSPGGTTYTGSGTSFTVTGLPVSTTYTFTVTNSNNCVSVASANTVINGIPSNPTLGGASAVCVGFTANVTPNSLGTWTSSNTAVATITNAGVVSAIAAGAVTLTYTRTSDGCSNTTPFTVNANPTAPVAGTITQPTCTTPTGSVVLSGLPASGSWTITRSPGGTTYTGSGTSFTVTGLPVSTTYTFTVTNSNNCVSVTSANTVINGIPSNPTLGGASAVCVGFTANVTPNSLGTWTSSNTAVATITNAGVVTGVTAGSVTLTYSRTSDGCSNTTPFTVNANPTAPVVGTITQPTCTTPTGSVVLSGLPASGSWTITRSPGGTTYTGSGTSFTVTGLPVSTTYTFTVTNSNNCVSVASANTVINGIPSNPTLGGTSAVCVGFTANVTPNSLGTWTSSNTAVATITNAGVVTGVTAGSVTLTYTRTSDGCSNTTPITVNANPTAPVVGTITQPTCTTPTGSVVLSGLPASGSWTITRTPGGTTYTGSGTSFTVTGLPVSTTYTFTVTNSNSCTSPSSANVVINPIPTNPVIGGATSVCVGATASVTPNTLGTWASSNIGIATITNAGVVTGIAAGSVTLTYTRTADGCANSIPFNVHSNPSTPVLGSITQPTCLLPTGSVFLNGLPATGSWTITRTPGGTTYSGSGTSYTVTGLPANATYTFTVTNSNSCTSPSSANVVINPIPTNPVIGGATSVCVGGTANVTPNTLGTWATSNTAIATITNAGAISGISAGSVSLTYTRTADGCSNTLPFTVNANPSAPVVGTIMQPTCITTTGSVDVSGLPASGSWTITRTPGGTTYSGSGTTYSVTGLPANTTYTFTVTNSNSCTSPSSANVVVNPIPTNPVAGGATSVCVGLTANVTPNTLGTWASSNNAIATVTNVGVVTGVAAGSVTLTYTRTADGCSNTLPFTVNANPSAPVIGIITQPTCIITTGSVDVSGLPASGSWTITGTPGGTTYSGSGTTYSVTGLPANATYTFTVTNSNSCTSPSSANVVVNPIPTNPVTGGAASVCVGLTANVTPNTSGTWASSNNAVATVTNVGVVTGVAAGSVTLTYTRTADGCSNTLPFTVNANPSAPVVGTITQPTCITTTGSVALSGLPASGSWTITRTPGGTTYSGSGTTYSVTGLPANATYTFTVTNSNSCTSPSSANVVINAIPTNPVTGGAASVCVGLTADVTPNTSGTWASSNNALATVTNVGVVTGVAAGSVTLTYTRTADGCSNTFPFTVNANPSAPVIGTITQPTCATPSGTVILSGLPASGSWTITRTPGSNTYTSSGTSYTVTGLPANATYTFTVTNSNSCTSPSSANVAISPIPGAPVLGGSVTVCIGGTANVTPSTNGTWLSSNSSIATVTNAGVVNAIAAGAVTLTYTRTADGCSNTLPFTVNANPSAPVVGTITQPTCITTTGSVALSGLPASGAWTITRTPGGTTYSGSGTTYAVTGLPANATYTFTVTNSNSCTSPSSANVVVNPIPTNPVTGGAASVCVGLTANVTPNTLGTWATSNAAIATITNAGVVTGVAAGSVTLTYTRTADGCSNTLPFTVNANPSAPVVGTITQPTCITTTGSVDVSGLPASGSWTITRTPGGTTYSSSGTTYSVTGLPANATYTFTVTNSNSCTSPSSTNVVVNPIPTNPVTGGAASVCVGLTANVTPNTLGTWATSNAAIATITNVGVVTGVAAGSVTLTYTRTADGCSNTLPFTVNANPSAPVIGTITQPTCITTTGSVALSGLPASGSWTITRTPGGTTYSGSGTTYSVTGLPANATYTFTVTNSNSCTSPSSANVAINAIPTNPVTGGAASVCVGLTANVTPNTSGTWASSSNAVATVTNVGVVTGVAAGSVTLTYTRTADGCSNTLPFTVNANPSAPVLVNITQPTCITTTGSVALSGLPASGSWTITRTPGGTTYSGSGNSYTVTGLPANATYTFTVTNTNNCTSPASTDVEINPIPTNPVTGGENTVCVGSTANVTPGTSGTWVSSNMVIATISNAGVVSGIVAGSVTLTYTRTADGCSNTLPFIVNANPSAPVIGTITQPTCITTTGSVDLSGLPASGSWTLTRIPGGTTYFGSGTSYTVTGLPANATYTFTVTNVNDCSSPSSTNVVINAIPTNPVTGGAASVCVGLTANVTPNTLGTWATSNAAIATITNVGVVTGVAAGSVTLTYTRTSDGCSNTLPFTVNANPSAPVVGTITQPTCITTTGSVALSGLPASGSWTITGTPGGTTYSGSGTTYSVTGLPANATYTFTVTNSNSCTSPSSTNVAINAIPTNPVTGGATSVCIGSDANVIPSNDGTWSSSNDALATITNAGVVTGVAAGSVT
ncbi:MAG: Ig-like domain-containing protein [Saprospiraceae bacterium]|nr:Ig-like domain-containing protein [Saprospiraceae bacterium]